ncbi:MAG TPA: bifunctional DNA-formamidopyrimidine glycosylase/DNA-(apurinic or apyrimidinic site) lyase [Candidatus Acidoferrum sp.]|nr:bifunctional DNA-formamidopyrimidine glycosylase/DNA-(apurinic or apyrimidinic site) lyase [Candidatus Acidoferrum sp.]
MPELPEVEAIAQTLRPFVEGHTIERCRVIHPIAAARISGKGKKEAAKNLEMRLRERRIERVERRGKFLILALDGGSAVMHFKFDGQLVWFDNAELRGHIDVALDMTHGTLGFFDPRHLGRVQWVESQEEIPGLRTMGIEPLAKEFTPERLREELAGSRKPIKLCLLDQAKIAGVGNIYSSEALWRSRIDPRRAAGRLSGTETKRLHRGIVDVLRSALKCCLHPAPNFRDANWWFQGTEKILRAYGREGKKCRRCGHEIVRIEQGGRGTYWCPGCQK